MVCEPVDGIKQHDYEKAVRFISWVLITCGYTVTGYDSAVHNLCRAHDCRNAVVTGGNANQVIILPKLDKVIGTLDYVTKIAGASEE